MVAAGMLAKKAVERGLTVPPWVKTSLAPGSRVVTDYYERSGLLPYLDKLGFNVVGYGCTTCIGNSGPLPTDVSKSIEDHGLVAVSVLSGNRNFEGRINSDVRANYLMVLMIWKFGASSGANLICSPFLDAATPVPAPAPAAAPNSCAFATTNNAAQHGSGGRAAANFSRGVLTFTFARARPLIGLDVVGPAVRRNRS